MPYWLLVNMEVKVMRDMVKVGISKSIKEVGMEMMVGMEVVVVISQTPEPKFGQDKVEAAVHTMGTNSWRSIGELEYSFWNSRSKVFEGCPYWIVHRVKPVVSRSEFVVSFSVGDEKFKEIPLPPLDNGMRLKNLTALGGRLSIFSYVYKLKCYELWVRMNDKLENTWTKQLSFNELDINGDGYINPLGFKNGLVLLQDRYDGPLFFDPVTSDVKALYLRGQPKEFLVYPYIESLAMLTVEDRGDVHQNS
ncbi:hypothetical protein NE237_010584 [Protea cynaroides]|uniref:F-box associated beta-propeller type 3 domain-containing protein n=1 Tax=Protea cynaroides TaxID=273540 RepID=A0A9Q0L002_9MAGN|nr:hypothetical protein NE237_010584 [Protea cynaroides]